MSETKTVADLAADEPIYVTTNRTSSTKRVHTDRRCERLRAADCPVIEKRPPMYRDETAVCDVCLNGGSGGGTDLSTYMAAVRAGGDADE